MVSGRDYLLGVRVLVIDLTKHGGSVVFYGTEARPSLTREGTPEFRLT